MNFSLDRNKQAQEVTFTGKSCNTVLLNHKLLITVPCNKLLKLYIKSI